MAVNHSRTLLLNDNPTQLADLSSIYIDPMFSPVSVPVEFVPLQRVLFPFALTLAERIDLVDGICTVLHMGELEPYTLRFDPRITYVTTPQWSMVDLCRSTEVLRTSVQEAMSRIRTFPVAGQISTRLFHWDAYADDLVWLQRAWSSHTEGILGFGAVVLAYIYQLEQVRRRM